MALDKDLCVCRSSLLCVRALQTPNEWSCVPAAALFLEWYSETTKAGWDGGEDWETL